jgi:hypothetical protein
MNRDDITRMAQEAGIYVTRPDEFQNICIDDLERFAALVAAAERKRIESRPWGAGTEWIARAVEAEREACAKVCDEMEQKAEGTECCKWPTPADCAHAIRAKGKA